MITTSEKQIVDFFVFYKTPVITLLNYQFDVLKFTETKYWRVPVATCGGYGVGFAVTYLALSIINDEREMTDEAKAKVSALCGIPLAVCGAYLSIKE